ncbi:MAG: Gfo/Idh/MocA family oxidoreductase [Thermoguttaceae bacterium]|nr:Gfo/Idh/MocA family oxidoreductase [Thermoguttaceae bacterium]
MPHFLPTRRRFLQTVTLATVAAPAVVPASVFGANAPSQRIGVAMIGTGNQSTIDLPAFLRNDDVQVLAVCDVNTASYGYQTKDQFLGREPARKLVNAYYAEKTRSGQYRGCDAYVDFRDVLARRDIDAVAIVTPDHWHGVMTVMAAEVGKDIFCQKPLSLTVAEGQAMVRAVRKHGRILQTGSQFRSSPACRFCCELVRNGRIGKLRTIRTFLAWNNFTGPGPGWKPMPVPEGFDYERWLGPAPWAPYHADRCLYRFRFIFDYSGGQMTNFGAHSNDIAQWGNGTDLSGPVEVEGLEAEWPPKGSLFNTALRSKFRARYANGVELICETGEPRMGARFEGSEGWVQFGFGGLKADPPSLLKTVLGPDAIRLDVSLPDRKEDVYGNYLPDHVRNFLNSVKSRRDPIAPVEVGHRTASLCHIGNIALRLMRKLRWDPAAERFDGDDEANRMLSRPLRGPWRV